MALLTEQEVRVAARTATLAKSASSVLHEARDTKLSAFDIFLSHSRLDAEIVLGAKKILENTGRTVYVDWIDDPLLDRQNVTPATAHRLRLRMRQSKSLFYLHSSNSNTSRWMPWELGYFDGFNGNVAIFPVLRAGEYHFKGQEFLGLYPYVDLTGRTATSSGALYIHRNNDQYARYDDWRVMSEKLRPAA